MAGVLEVGEVCAEVVRKDIKHIHLTVLPPDGKVRIAAPRSVSEEAIRLFAINKLSWIRRQQKKFHDQLREAPREYLERESHYLWGRRYLLHIVERDAAPVVRKHHQRIELQVRPGAGIDRKEAVLHGWYRDEIRRALPALLEKWQPIVDVRARAVFVQRMKMKWGSCNATSGNIRINTELAKKPPECLEYILVHELVHLREPTHGPRFVEWMDRLLPHWRNSRNRLNSLPVRNEHWDY